MKNSIKVKKIIKGIFTALLCLILVSGIAVAVFFATYIPKLNFDFSKKTGDVTTGASGYLYGIAERGVPSDEMIESIDVSSVSQKVIDGKQHPIGDINNVIGALDNTDYNVVYVQDVYDSWYYLDDDIIQSRKNNTYNWRKLLQDDYLPKVEETVKKLSNQPYSDKIVYCIYNECDNGVWFGKTEFGDDGNVWCNYNDEGRSAFNSAWKQTYDLVKSINPNALVGGPGFCDYYSEEIRFFMEFCRDNDCVPDVMIYHELIDDSVYYWQNHVEDYRAMEKEFGIDEKPIIVTEYGRPIDNGYPGKMIQYVTQIEESKVYANNAYWRLADNLNDTCSDDNSPNANWWLMRWYADMQGQSVKCKISDILHADVKRSLREKKSLDYVGFMGLASIDEDDEKIDIICGGDSEGEVILKNLNKTCFKNKTVEITIEEAVYKGLYGVVDKSVVMKKYSQTLKDNLKIRLDDIDKANVYHISIRPLSGDGENYVNDNLPVRYEFENGTLLGGAYTYQCYEGPTSGETQGMCGGFENMGDGITLDIEVPKDGMYRLEFVYGNSNDGVPDENGRQSPDDRVDTKAKLTISRDDSDIEYDMSLPNTIRSGYTSCYTIEQILNKGKNTIKLEHIEGTFVLDSLVLTYIENEDKNLSLIYDDDRSDDNKTSYLTVAPTDGYYEIKCSDKGEVEISSVLLGTDDDGILKAYLKRGLNYIEVFAESDIISISPLDEDAGVTFTARDARLTGTAFIDSINGREYIDGITCNSGGADYTFTVNKEGAYRVTLLYSNNEERGVHDYNVDLIERYVSVSVNGSKQENIYCRNTYSWQTFKTVTFTVNLKRGENTIEFKNNGSERFNSRDTTAPRISAVSVKQAQM